MVVIELKKKKKLHVNLPIKLSMKLLKIYQKIYSLPHTFAVVTINLLGQFQVAMNL
ncbi:Uncharacterised protein [Mycobacteroides abscessus subsp. abscessus]|nr:Uncharacterised protein [Mycobacteroides abscessus]SIN56922.1 Uncharacterised protein [Mycobacteroides abscessus subsp. abscessus]